MLRLSLISLLLFLSGCASYRMGEPANLPYSKISVAPPLNNTTLPTLEGPLNAALRQAIMQSGPLKLSQPGQDDATLEVSILEAKRGIAAVTSEDVGRGRKFELVLQVELSLAKPNSSEDYFIRSRQFTVKQDIFTESGQVDAEYQAIPEISRKIATQAIEILTDLW